jgi:hypothetical protein
MKVAGSERVQAEAAHLVPRFGLAATHFLANRLLRGWLRPPSAVQPSHWHHRGRYRVATNPHQSRS